MPARVIRGEILASDSLSRVSIEADSFFFRLVIAADDFGRLDGRLSVLRSVTFPVRDVPPVQIEAWLAELERADGDSRGPVLRYLVEGRPYIQLVGWEKHRSNSKRAKESRFPEPPRESPGDSRGVTEIRPSDVLRVTSDECRVGRSRAKHAAPEAFSAEQWSRLETLLRESRPWLLDERSIELSPHCCVGWVRGQVEETLSYWRGRSDAKALKSDRGWVDTALNRIQSEDSRRWERAGKEPPIADIIRAHAAFTPLTPPSLRGAA